MSKNKNAKLLLNETEDVTAEATGNLFESILNFIKSIPEKFEWLFEKIGIKAAYDKILEYLGCFSMENPTAASVTKWSVVAIIALGAIWKLIKYFIKDNGEVDENAKSSETDTEAPDEKNLGAEPNQISGEPEPVIPDEIPTSESYNPVCKNYAYAAILYEIDTGEVMPNTIATSTASAVLKSLLADNKFNAFMKKENAELLTMLKSYNDELESISENLISRQKLRAIFESTEDAGANTNTKVDNKILSWFKDTWDKIVGVLYNRDKPKNIDNVYSNNIEPLSQKFSTSNSNKAVFNTSKNDLTVLMISTAWLANDVNNKASVVNASNDYEFMRNLREALNIINEIKENISDANLLRINLKKDINDVCDSIKKKATQTSKNLLSDDKLVDILSNNHKPYLKILESYKN